VPMIGALPIALAGIGTALFVLPTILGTLKENFGNTMGAIGDMALHVAGSVGRVFAGIGRAAGSLVAGVAKGAFAFFADLGATMMKASDLYSTEFGKILKVGKEVFGDLSELITGEMTFKEFGDRFKVTMGEAWDSIKAIGTQVWEDLTEVAARQFRSGGEGARTAYDYVVEGFGVKDLMVLTSGNTTIGNLANDTSKLLADLPKATTVQQAYNQALAEGKEITVALVPANKQLAESTEQVSAAETVAAATTDQVTAARARLGEMIVSGIHKIGDYLAITKTATKVQQTETVAQSDAYQRMIDKIKSGGSQYDNTVMGMAGTTRYATTQMSDDWGYWADDVDTSIGQMSDALSGFSTNVGQAIADAGFAHTSYVNSVADEMHFLNVTQEQAIYSYQQYIDGINRAMGNGVDKIILTFEQFVQQWAENSDGWRQYNARMCADVQQQWADLNKSLTDMDWTLPNPEFSGGWDTIEMGAHAAGGKTRHPLAMVGERGPEVVALPVGSRVMPHGEMRGLVGSLPKFAAGGVMGLGRPTMPEINDPTSMHYINPMVTPNYSAVMRGAGAAIMRRYEIALNAWYANQRRIQHEIELQREQDEHRRRLAIMHVSDTQQQPRTNMHVSDTQQQPRTNDTAGSITINGPLIQADVNANDSQSVESFLETVSKEITGRLQSWGLSSYQYV